MDEFCFLVNVHTIETGLKEESPADARVTRSAPSFQDGGSSKMAVSRHL